MMVSKKGLLPSIWKEIRKFQLRIDCIATLSMMASIVVGSLVQQVWLPLSY